MKTYIERLMSVCKDFKESDMSVDDLRSWLNTALAPEPEVGGGKYIAQMRSEIEDELELIALTGDHEDQRLRSIELIDRFLVWLRDEKMKLSRK